MTPIRILHVVGGMDRGGAETWLMHVLRHLSRAQFQTDFLVHTERPCAYDAEARALGSAIIPCMTPGKPLAYARSFQQIMAERGPYDVVHSHVHHFSGLVLRLSRQAGVGRRIAHSHNDTAAVDRVASLPRRLYLALMRRLIEQHATLGLAASRQAGRALFGAAWERRRARATLYCGIDMRRFRAPADRQGLRAALGIPPDALVIGHVGRFDPQKNHGFLVDVAADVLRREPRALLLLVGDGRLRPAIAAQAERLGLAGRVRFAGARDDVPQLMAGVFDAFVMPSVYEGLPLALMEAQAAGLRCVIADTISAEADCIPAHIRRLPLALPAAGWADAVLETLRAGPALPPHMALAIMERSPFSIDASVERLEAYYRV